MSEVWRSLTEGGNWTPRERRVGRWIRRALLVAVVVGLLGWNAHMQRRGAQSQVWIEWVNNQCQSGDDSRCMSYVAFSDKSGMPNGRFWTQNPKQAEIAHCIEMKGWTRLNPIQAVDYTELANHCR